MREGLVVYRKGPHLGVMLEGKVYISVPRSRLKGKILVGDRVLCKPVDDMKVRVEEVLPRKNYLPRPPVANVDLVLAVFSLRQPSLEPKHLDSVLVILEKYSVEPVIILNKADLVDEGEVMKWYDLYTRAGYEVIPMSLKTGRGLEDLKRVLTRGIHVMAGPSGSGKTSLARELIPNVELKVGDLRRDGKGKHTTTDITLLELPGGGYLCDTPGFARVDITRFVTRHELPKLYRDFRVFNCKFKNCTHTSEPGCEVVQRADPLRYSTYLRLLREYQHVRL